MEEEPTKIKIVTKKAYGIFQKLFCCRCFHCLQADDESMLTSDIRKQTFQRMIKNFAIESNFDDKSLFDPLKLMITIYLCEDKTIPHRFIQRCQINPKVNARVRNRTDIEFYIPQICNFLVFHEELKYDQLMDDMLTACRLNYFFGHLYYFYMNSLSKVIINNSEYSYGQVKKYNALLLDLMSKEFGDNRLICTDFYNGMRKPVTERPAVADNVKKYGTIEEDECNKGMEITAEDISLPSYYSIYAKEVSSEPFSFRSTINFFEDLFVIASDIKNADPRTKALKHLLKRMNERLPAQVYIPFYTSTMLNNSGSLRLYNVLNIVVDEARVFSTKERAPFYICLQIFNPAEQLSEQQAKKLQEFIDRPVTIRSSLQHFSEGVIDRRSLQTPRVTEFRNSADMKSDLLTEYRHQTEIFDGKSEGRKSGRFLTNKLLEFTNSIETAHRVGRDKETEMKELDGKSSGYAQKLGGIFGERVDKMTDRLRAKSIFGGLKSWRLLHMMVKTGDNLKQEQFALQLITQFNYIFKLESVPLLLTPYEVISMGPDCGVMEMIRDTVTMDGLLKKLKEDHPRIHSLKQFFEAYYVEDLHKVKMRFTRSLAAYSLVMYFMQVKDRHNGNILLHRDGKIIHIDFGFFLSNAPGKGVQLEKWAPFKLNTQYIEVMDGAESTYFEEFRKLFYQYIVLLRRGFQAARKHQDKILILVKMMYSSSGATMPCFEKGEIALKELQARFNPPEIDNDLQLSQHCQQLINLSLDNWRTRWYDKWQYWAQGIFY